MSNFRTIHTTAGLATMTSAEATGTPINLTHMAVGDGNGNPVTPLENQTNLVRELFRATINRVYQDPVTPTRFTAELVIPASAGGFVLREVGVFDSNGTLFAVGNLPDTYKPVASEGAFADTVVRLEFMVTNADVINIVFDPNVVVVTQTWITNNVTACLIIPGGTTGQILRKASNGCGDTEWADPAEATNITVNSIEETQTLAAAQTVVDWAVVNNSGLAVYIEGVRLRADQWTAHPTIGTRITLATSYPVGTKIVGAQNEPAGTMVDPLEQAQNLADVPDKAVARANLDVFSRAESLAAGQPGDVKHTARSTAPAGWLKANGAAVSRTAYAELFSAIGTTYGAGDGFNTFNLPDLRGQFVRGWDDGRGVDPGRVLGSAQGDAIRNITGTFDGNVNDGVGGKTGAFAYSGVGYSGADGTSNALGGIISFDASRVVPTANENRPRNTALLACIKF